MGRVVGDYLQLHGPLYWHYYEEWFDLTAITSREGPFAGGVATLRNHDFA